ncbi:MAG: hypothetical protein MJ078_01120 [Clostridia bacterium]|nr:hypothetical protein [Clostridia bacterium]
MDFFQKWRRPLTFLFFLLTFGIGVYTLLTGRIGLLGFRTDYPEKMYFLYIRGGYTAVSPLNYFVHWGLSALFFFSLLGLFLCLSKKRR